MELQGYSSTGVVYHDAEIHNEFGISFQEGMIKREEFNSSMACSILEPMTQIVAGYQGVMPTYQGLLSDRELDALIAFLKTLNEDSQI